MTFSEWWNKIRGWVSEGGSQEAKCRAAFEAGKLTEAQECLVEQVRLTEVEKQRRIYYQDIVYTVCNELDRAFGKSIRYGKGIVCGTLDTPTTEVQEHMKILADRGIAWAEEQARKQTPKVPVKPTNEQTAEEYAAKCDRLARGIHDGH